MCLDTSNRVIQRSPKTPLLFRIPMPLIKDAGLETLHEVLGCRLKHTKVLLDESLENALTLSDTGYAIRTKAIKAFSDAPFEIIEKFNDKFREIEEIESGLECFLTPESEDLKELQEEALSQLSFQDDYFRCLNFVPYFLLGMALFKVWIVPAMAIIIPFIAWIIPYIFLKFMYKLPISTEQYGDIMKMMWSGSPVEFMKGEGNGLPKLKSPDLLSARSIIQGAFMIFSFTQSLVQPIQNAYHLYKIDQKILENGQKVLRLLTIYSEFKEEFKGLGITFRYRNSLRGVDLDPRRAIHLLIEEPERLRIVLSEFADYEILWRVASSPILNQSDMIFNGDYPLIRAAEINDISLGPSAVPSSFTFTGESHHAVLTGPNGGGKSSFLRAILQCCLLSHAYGVAPAEKFVIRKLSWISSGLRLQDNPGNLSMFESEVFFASNVLKRTAADGIGLILYDELFHSTNPPDGIRTAEGFLKQLWTRASVISIVSTHVFELVESAPKSVQRLCCSAEEGKNKSLKFMYDIKPGICKVSSVKSIWDRFGLFPPAGKPRPEKQGTLQN